MNDEPASIDSSSKFITEETIDNKSPTQGDDRSTTQGSDRSSARDSDATSTRVKPGVVASGASRQLRKTELCKYFLKASCQWGTECNFAHGAAEIEQPPGFWKTQICIAWKEGVCQNQNCSFAHGETDLSETAFKTTMCIWWKSKKGCRNGEDCQFAHGIKQLRVTADSLQLASQEISPQHSAAKEVTLSKALTKLDQQTKALLSTYAETVPAAGVNATAPVMLMPPPAGLPPGLEADAPATDITDPDHKKESTTSQLQMLGSTVQTLMAQVNYLQQQLEEREERTPKAQCLVQDITSQSAAARVTSHWLGGPARKRRAFARARAHWLRLQQKDDLDDEQVEELASLELEIAGDGKGVVPGAEAAVKASPTTPSTTTLKSSASTPLKSNAKPFEPLKSSAKPFEPAKNWSCNPYAMGGPFNPSTPDVRDGWNPYSWQ